MVGVEFCRVENGDAALLSPDFYAGRREGETAAGRFVGRGDDEGGYEPGFFKFVKRDKIWVR